MSLLPLCLVVGGSGFLGKCLVREILSTGRYRVRVFDVRATEEKNVEMVIGDLRKLDDVVKATQGVDIVFHVATAAPTGENALNKKLMDEVNVGGTRNVVTACQQNGVPKLVYTSSASVVFEGRDLLLVDESAPYATKPLDYYTRTKIEGEKLVLAANGTSGVATCALRPSGIFGEGDAVMVPTTVRNVKAGKLKYIIGDGKNLFDWTYVGNVAQAHVQAGDALSLASPLAGQSYFITNQEPMPFWTFLGDICEGLGYSRPTKHLPALLILVIAVIFEYIIRPLVKPFKELSSDFTVSRIYIVTVNRTFSSQKAKEHFGYVPRVSLEEGKQRTIKAFAYLAASTQERGATT